MSIVKDVLNFVAKELLTAFDSDAISKGADVDTVPGDVDIRITLMSQDGQRKYNLISQCTGVEIYESITSPAMFAELFISDSMGLYQSFPLIGEEFVLIELKSPDKTGLKSARYLFRADEIRDKKVGENNKNVTYTIPLYSAELIDNAKVYVNKTYEDSVNNIVKNIFEEYIKSEKPIKIDDTTGVEKVTITRLQPFRAIDFLRRRSISNKYLSSSFVFYENRDGYNFTTIEKLLFEGSKKIGFGSDKRFFFDTARKENIKDVTNRNIIAYNQITNGSQLSQIQTGGFTSIQQTYDIISGGIRRVSYTDNVGGDKFKLGSDSAASKNTTDFVRQHGKTTAVVNIKPTAGDRPEMNIGESMVSRRAFANKVAQNITQIHIYGDTELSIGDVIKCDLPAAIDANDNKGKSRLDSGNYLVSKLRHMITIGDRPQHTMSLELIRGFLEETA